ncbi:cholinesterase 1 isoform X2 [Cherax quadricarinatus]|uniref:cholinesterase 1 isoform X2 n=1 Tax=Cherax quadricarinatus TaxID=27406 RepID=UPI00387E240A
MFALALPLRTSDRQDGRMKVLATIVLALSAAVVALQEAPFVMTEGGMISGLIQRSTRSRTFYSYYNIPFAKPPLGHLRFKDKEPKPELPVMVWIHGGAFFSGGAFEYMPHVLLNHDVVLVVIQYRLGVIGFLSTEDSVIPGNFGLKDQTLALQWVQRNIHNFGGDKTKVTIFGESAGSSSAHFQMFSPKSQGLFSRVIMQSGSALSPWATGWKFRETAEEIGQTMGCPVSQDSQALIDCLQKVDGHKLTVVVQDYFQWHILPLIFGPRVDGDFIPDDPAKLVLEGRYHKVDLMAGVTGDEGAFATHAMFANRNLINDLKANFTTTGPASIQLMEAVDGEDVVEMARRVYFYYLGKGLNIDEDHSEALTQLYSDIHFMVDYDLVTQYYAHHAHHRNTYRYEFRYRGELSFGDLFDTNVGKHWVPHEDELLYLFQAEELLGPSKYLQQLRTPEDLEMRDIMSKLWTNFATTGNPTPDDSLGFTWEPSTEDNLHYLALNLKPTMEADRRQEVRKFFASLPLKMNSILYPDRVLQDHTLQQENSRRTMRNEL